MRKEYVTALKITFFQTQHHYKNQIFKIKIKKHISII